LRAAAGLQDRESATHDLAAARKEVLAAQAETKRTRQALDEFLASHLDAQREAAIEQAVSDADRQQQFKLRGELQSQLAELQARRGTLLETLTEEHPEVIELAARIEGIEGRLKTSDAAELTDEDDRAGQATGPALDAVKYEQLLRDWRIAERRLESARLAETAAADRLTAVTDLLLHGPAIRDESPVFSSLADVQPQSPNKPIDQLDTASAGAPPAPTHDSHNENASRTQTLALASLALAVMLAALAAVRLARATADPLFASADEVSAALAVPVVGIVPFGAKSATAGDMGMRRGLGMLGQVVLALALFSAVAYAVVHFDAVLRLISDPVGTLRSWFGL
jgi:hypothetical protein